MKSISVTNEFCEAVKSPTSRSSSGVQFHIHADHDSVYSTGSSNCGELGHPRGGLRFSPVPKYVRCLSGRGILAISCGDSHCIAVTRLGTVISWGSNRCGQLGIGYHASGNSGIHTVPIPFDSPVTAVSAGFGHSLALTQSGELLAWGLNSHGQLGLGSTCTVYIPSRVVLSFPARLVAAGGLYSLCSDGDRCVAYSGRPPGQAITTVFNDQVEPIHILLPGRVVGLEARWDCMSVQWHMTIWDVSPRLLVANCDTVPVRVVVGGCIDRLTEDISVVAEGQKWNASIASVVDEGCTVLTCNIPCLHLQAGTIHLSVTIPTLDYPIEGHHPTSAVIEILAADCLSFAYPIHVILCHIYEPRFVPIDMYAHRPIPVCDLSVRISDEQHECEFLTAAKLVGNKLVFESPCLTDSVFGHQFIMHLLINSQPLQLSLPVVFYDARIQRVVLGPGALITNIVIQYWHSVYPGVDHVIGATTIKARVADGFPVVARNCAMLGRDSMEVSLAQDVQLGTGQALGVSVDEGLHWTTNGDYIMVTDPQPDTVDCNESLLP